MIQEIFSLQNPWRSDSEYSFDLKKRDILPTILSNLKHKKIIGLLGSRQVGKSSIIYLVINHLLKSQINKSNIFYFNLDDLKLHDLFDNLPIFIQFLGKEKERKYVFIDEIQRLNTPGLFLKEVHDLGLNIKIFYSGSSQLEIKSKLKEHLVGRARQFEIHRLGFEEYINFSQPITRKQALQDILIYGSYPAIALEQDKTEKKLSIKDIYQSYIEKDLVDFLNIGNINAFNRLISILAYQSGRLLNIDSLARSIRISRVETEKYVNILEQTFIIRRVYPFHKNYKKEVTKTPKIFFLDLGLRNYSLNNFNTFEGRQDIGELFENFHFLEMLQSDPHGLNKINYWRTTNQTEIDFIHIKENKTEAIEVKWDKETIPKSFKTLAKYYPNIPAKVLTHKEYLGTS